MKSTKKKLDVLKKRYVFGFDKVVLALFIITCVFLISLDSHPPKDKPQVNAANIYADQGWTYRKSITVNNAQVSGSTNFTDFPVLVNLASDAQLAASAQSDGDDIFFTSSDGITKIPHEIEKYTTGTGALTAWVKVPTLSATVDTVIYLYYGNGSATNQEDAANVWNSNFMGVWHLAEDPSVSTDGDCGGGTKEVCDSTVNNGDGDSAGTMTDTDLISAVIGDGINFDGIDDRLNFGDINNITTNDFSLSFWFRTTKNTSGAHPIAKGVNSNPGYRTYLNGSIGRLGFAIRDSVGTQVDTTPGSYTPLANNGAWQYATWNFDRDASATIYINGSQKFSTSIATLNGQSLTNTDPLYIGRAGIGQYWDGDLDEVRIHNGLKTSDYVATEYNNQNSPATFYTVGSQEFLETFCGDGNTQTPNDDGDNEQCDDGNTNSGDGCSATCTLESNPAYWYKRKSISLESDLVSGSTNLTNFPVLISISSDTDLVSSAQSDADDIKFTLSDGTTQLSHEIEYYNPSTGQLQAWVKIPSLGATSDTQIYMYYGNSQASNQQSISNTWSNGYVGVWHLNETSGSADDSTSNANNGTRNNVTANAVGKIDGADSFNGVSGPTNGSHITVPLNSSLDFNNDFTISAWANVDALPSTAGFNYSLVSKSLITSITTSWTLYLNSSTNYLSLLVGNGTSSNTYGDASLLAQANQWAYYAASFDEGGVVNLRVNGSTAQKGTNVQMEPSSTKQLYLGAMNNGYDNLDGTMDEVRISNVARSNDWLATEYNNQNTPGTFHTISSEEVLTYCGDTTIQAPNGQGVTEQCDDGVDNGVTCSAAYGETCDYCSNTCQTTTVNGAMCGDGNIEAGEGEVCDDGVNNGVACDPEYESTCDYCNNSCQTVTLNGATCGDGSTDASDGENCDAGVNNGVTCSAAYGETCDYCSNSCQTITVDGASCGDENPDLGNGEQCDDGNNTNGDGCDSLCRNEVCGNNVVQSGETCDDGNTDSGDGCSDTCQLESCGDGITQSGEQCDDGVSNGNVCTASYGSSCNYCSNSCQTVTVDGASCGDGSIDAGNGEQCDDGVSNGNVCSASYGSSCNYCSNSCQTTTVQGASCGDGNTDAGNGEQCDDSNNTNGDGCSSTCQIEQCGDGIQQSGEQCDDGNQTNNDGCSSTCQNEVCGDGVTQTGEECDAGGNNGNACSAAYGGTCNYCNNSCETVTVQGATCGDGNTDAVNGEECDAGVNNGDVCSTTYGNTCNYCSNTCETETVQGGLCGDGNIDYSNSEQCDDSNTSNGDGCDDSCQYEIDNPETQAYCGPIDVNSDSRITLVDFVNFTSVYGKQCVDPGFGSGCGAKDRNSDSIIGLVDFVQFVSQFNENTCN